MYCETRPAGLGFVATAATAVGVAQGVKNLFGGGDKKAQRIDDHLRGEGAVNCEGPYSLNQFVEAVRSAPSQAIDQLYADYESSQGEWFRTVYPTPQTILQGDPKALRNLALGGGDCHASTKQGRTLKEAVINFVSTYGGGNRPAGTMRLVAGHGTLSKEGKAKYLAQKTGNLQEPGWDWSSFFQDQAANAGGFLVEKYGADAARSELKRQAPALTAGAISGGAMALAATGLVLLVPRLLK